MMMIHKGDRLALVFLLCTVPGLAQQDQAPKSEAPPQANAPQTENPPAPTPSGEPQSPVPSVQQDHAPEPNPPLPVEENPPTSKPPSKVRKPVASAKTSATAKKRRNKSAASSKSVVRPSSAGDSSGQTGKVVVRNGGAREGRIQLSPGGSQEQELHNRENTSQLLATTDVNLKRISGRQLTPSEQSTFDQIQSYVRQARSASDAGDMARAHTLAFKAHLLSDDLAKR